MTDLTTRPIEAGTPGPAPVPVNGAAAGDIRALRHASRAEQDRLSADAEVERRARAARLELELREQRRAAARRERQADEQDKRVRTDQRRARRAARRAQLRAAAPRWADRALFILPILFPMAVAWVGQIRFAMTVMSWPLPAAIVFAAGFELSTAYVARLDWRSRAAGDSALLFRGATWGFAAGAAIMNYWHAAGPDFAPTGEAVSYGMMSITGVVLWELLSTYRHRTALRAEGKLPAARPRFGPARWIWFRPLTRLAWLLALRDGYTTTDLAWRAALAAVD
jgi:cation transport ATPase